MRKLIEDFDNYLEKSPLALRVVPLPEFTISRTPQKNRFNIASNIFLFLFIPRWYKISRDEKNLLSSFSRVVRYENNDDMYDNPATEANPNDPKIKVKSDTLSGAVTNIINNETLFNITLESDYDVVDRNDNPFSSFSTAITAAYFWLNGDMIQKDRFDFWVIDLFTLIASIFIVTVLQNMFIAFMSGVYVKAETKGRQALLRFRANQIADYEALEHFHFWPNEPEPKFIHYIGQSKNFQEWFQLRKDDQGEIYKDFDEKTTNTIQAFIDVDYDESSIWNFDDNNSSNTKGKKKDSTTALPKETIPSNSSENSQEVVLNELNEKINEIMKKAKDDIQNLFNNVPQNL
uniref:Ion transport domain-containing protein n=1 Tax=Rhizophagus irregularis (strain DAOM 181602 / DAOM 197198 / MUCL 43194) TaxID=747089 RepID=U9STY8_RHIID